MSKFYGNADATELPTVRIWDPRLGDSFERRWRGRPTAIDILEATFRSEGIRYRREAETHGGAYWIITAIFGAEETQPAGEPLADYWSMPGGDYEKSIWAAPQVKAELAKLYSDPGGVIDPVQLAGMARLKADIEALGRGDPVTYDASSGEEETLTVETLLATIGGYNASIDLEVIKKVIAAFATGQDTYLESQCVLRNIKVVAKGSTVEPSLDNIDRVFLTTTALVALESVPEEDLPFTLPNGQWLKKQPTCDQIAADKWQIVQDYLHAEVWPFPYLEAS